MGELYDEFQSEFKDAFDNDLSEATTILTIYKKPDQTNSDYDPITGSITTVDTVYTMRCILLSNKENEELEDSFSTDWLKILILDSEKTIHSFETELKCTVNGDKYTIKSFKTDPINATHTIRLRRA